MKNVLNKILTLKKTSLSHTQKLDSVFLLLLILLSLFYISRWYTPFIFPSSDGGTIFSLAQSFAEGRGYRNICSVDESIHSHFPFGWPFLLSLVLRTPEFNHTGVHLLTSIFFILAALVIYLLSRCFFKPVPSFFISFAFVSHNLLCILNQTGFSEIPFAFFLYSSFLLFTIAIRSDNKWYYTAALVFVILTTFIRTIGEVLIISCALSLILQKKWKYLSLLAIFICLKFTLHFAIQDTEWVTKGYLQTDVPLLKIFFKTPSIPGATSTHVFSHSTFFSRYLLNIRRMLLTHIPMDIFPTLYHSYPMNKFKILITFLISSCVFTGLIISCKQRSYFIPLSLLCMIAVILTWSNPFAVYRYYAPFTSLYILFGLITLQKVKDILPSGKKYLILFRALLVILAVLFITDRTLYNNKILSKSFLHANPEAVTDFEDFCTCLGSSSSNKVLPYSPVPGMTFIFTHKKTFYFPWRTDTTQNWCDILTSSDNNLIIIPGWWHFMSGFSINQLKEAFTEKSPDGYFELRYGSSYPTYAFFSKTENEEIVESFQNCLNIEKLEISFIEGNKQSNTNDDTITAFKYSLELN